MPNTHIHESKQPDGFVWADDVVDADRECGHPRQPSRDRCKVCHRALMLHCTKCNIQVTACLCTMIERMEPIEAYKKLAQQVGQTQARAEMQRFGYNMPILPSLPL